MPISNHALTVRGMDGISARGSQLFAVQLAFLILGWIFAGLRAYVRIFMIKKVTLDDYLMLFAILGYTIYSSIALDGVVNGASRARLSDITIPRVVVSLRAWYLCEVLYSPITAAIRTSIAVFLLRLATDKIHKWIIWVNMLIIWLLSLVFFLILLLQCQPLNHYWMQVLGQPGTCMSPNVVANATVAHSVISALSDWTLGLLPIVMLWNVQLNKRTKVTISVLLGMGLIAGFALIARIPLVKSISISTDFLAQTVDLAIWTVLEPSLGIIAGCAASLRPLFKAWGFGPKTIRKYAFRSKGSVSWMRSRSKNRSVSTSVNISDPTFIASTNVDLDLQDARRPYFKPGHFDVERDPYNVQQSPSMGTFSSMYLSAEPRMVVGSADSSPILPFHGRASTR